MSSTVTLATTTLTYGIGSGDGELTLASVTGIVPSSQLFIDKELFDVLNVVDGTTRVKVKRGFDGSAAGPHSSGAVVWIGMPHQFYSTDPAGVPPAITPVAPYINVINGNIWYSQGDAMPDGAVNRWWQLATPSYGYGSLGVRTASQDISSST